jgi:hypothetical protein
MNFPIFNIELVINAEVIGYRCRILSVLWFVQLAFRFLLNIFLNFVYFILDFININTYAFLIYHIQINCFHQLSIVPNPFRDRFIINVINTCPTDHSFIELTNVLAAITKKQISFALLFEIIDLSVVNLSLRVLDFSVSNDLVLFPLSSYNLAWWKYQATFSKKFIS